MKKIRCLLVILVFVCTAAGANETDFNCVTIAGKVADLLFAGSTRGVYKSSDGARSWKLVLSVWGGKKVNYIFYDAKEGRIYAATENGLYASGDAGESWKLAYRGQGKWKNILCLAKAGDKLYLATSGGLLLHYAKIWQKVDNGLPELETTAVALDPSQPQVIYAANTQGVFKSSDGAKTWAKVFVSIGKSNEQVIEGSETEEDDTQRLIAQVRCIAMDEGSPSRVYLGTDAGVFYSKDQGEVFSRITRAGLGSSYINFILAQKKKIYVATPKGVFVYEKEKELWQELYSGITQPDVNFIAEDDVNKVLWLASKSGVVKVSASLQDENIARLEVRDISNEPNIRQVQEVAVDYAEVNANKIKEWRKKAKMKAILPRLTVGMDRSNNTNYAIYTSATTRYIYEGPQDEKFGWDVSLNWELSDLVWSEAQTSIDTRSRLMD